MHVHDGQVGSPPLLHILICVQPHQQEVTQFPRFLQQGSTELVSGALWLRGPAGESIGGHDMPASRCHTLLLAEHCFLPPQQDSLSCCASCNTRFTSASFLTAAHVMAAVCSLHGQTMPGSGSFASCSKALIPAPTSRPSRLHASCIMLQLHALQGTVMQLHSVPSSKMQQHASPGTKPPA